MTRIDNKEFTIPSHTRLCYALGSKTVRRGPCPIPRLCRSVACNCKLASKSAAYNCKQQVQFLETAIENNMNVQMVMPCKYIGGER